MPGCVLHVRGEDFDVDAFLAQAHFTLITSTGAVSRVVITVATTTTADSASMLAVSMVI